MSFSQITERDFLEPNLSIILEIRIILVTSPVAVKKNWSRGLLENDRSRKLSSVAGMPSCSFLLPGFPHADDHGVGPRQTGCWGILFGLAFQYWIGMPDPVLYRICEESFGDRYVVFACVFSLLPFVFGLLMGLPALYCLSHEIGYMLL